MALIVKRQEVEGGKKKREYEVFGPQLSLSLSLTPVIVL